MEEARGEVFSDANFCKAKAKERGARHPSPRYKAHKGANHGYLISCCYRDDGALRVNHRGLFETPRMVTAHRN